ncbi:MAG: redoxin domain-containing protein [Planctomycetes bacterium]|nr:redoxin domain-containing protein [Planctomycetota bacterium]
MLPRSAARSRHRRRSPSKELVEEARASARPPRFRAMRILRVAILTLLGSCAALTAQEPADTPLARLESSYWDAHGVASEALHKALDSDEEPARQAEYDAVLATFRERFAALARQLEGGLDPEAPAEANAVDVEAAVGAWTWVASLGWRGDEKARDAARGAVRHLLERHLSSPALGGLVRRLTYVDGAMDQAACCAALRQLIAGTPHADLRRQAQLATVRLLVAADAPTPETRREALELLAALLAERGEGPEAADAKRWQFELEHLQVGMVAPDFTAVDQHGVTFSLSDYRGKVVVLDFWGDW